MIAIIVRLKASVKDLNMSLGHFDPCWLVQSVTCFYRFYSKWALLVTTLSSWHSEALVWEKVTNIYFQDNLFLSVGKRLWTCISWRTLLWITGCSSWNMTSYWLKAEQGHSIKLSFRRKEQEGKNICLLLAFPPQLHVPTTPVYLLPIE